MSSEYMHSASERNSAILGAVLTGGASRRMGRDKATLDFQDSSLAARAVNALQEVFKDVVIVSSGLAKHEFFGVPVVKDTYSGCGPLGGLHAALQAAAGVRSRRGVLILACDMPFVSPEIVRFLVARSSSSDSKAAWACVPRMNDHLEPLCAVYSSGCLELAATALEERSFKMSDFLERIATDRAEISEELPFFDWNLFSNVNRPGDLMEICEKMDADKGIEFQDPSEVKS